MRALVLGATGFIGNHVARALLAAGHEVRTLRRGPRPSIALEGIESDVEQVRGDVRDAKSVRSALGGCDALFHVAAHYPTNSLRLADDLRAGVESVRPVFEAARAANTARVVYVSSLSTIGRPGEPGRLADERDYYLPGSSGHPYPEAKFAMEQEAYRFIAQGAPLVIACPTAVFGPRDVKPTSGAALIAITRGQMPFYVRGQTNVTDVRDVAAGLLAAGERGRVGEKYLIGGWNVTVRQMLELMAEAAGVEAPRRSFPTGLAYILAAMGERITSVMPGGPVRYLTTGVEQVRHGQFLDCSKAVRELGVTRRPLAETFRDTLEWFRSHGYV